MSQQQEKQFLSALEQQFTQQYTERLNKASDSQQESARCLAELAAKVSVIEALLLKEQNVNVSGEIELLKETLTLDAAHLLDNDNLLEVEFHNGRAIRWSGVDPRIDLPLLICRNENKNIVISVVAVAKPEFIQQLSIFADGMPLKFVAKEDDGMIKLIASLPSQKNKLSATLLSILLPETVSPASLGQSNDTRKLGIAMHQISVEKVRKKRFRFGK